MAGAFVASPELRAYAANTIGSADIIDNSIQSADIGDGQVKSADIANSTVTNSKIGSSAVTGSKVSSGFMKRVHLNDDATGHAAGWDPSGTNNLSHMFDSAVTGSSIILATMDNNENGGTGYSPYNHCSVSNIKTGEFLLGCDNVGGDGNPPAGSKLHYVVIKG